MGARHRNGRSGGTSAISPIVIEAAAEAGAAQSDDGVGVADGPEHAGALEARADHGFAFGFDDAGADRQALGAEVWIAHPCGVTFEVLGFVVDDSGEFLGVRLNGAQELYQGFDLAVFEPLETRGEPAFAGLAVARE